jgi:antitoxin VapB
VALNIKNPQVEQLAAEVAQLARETKTEAIRRALVERKARLEVRTGRATKGKRLKEYLERFVWPNIPADVRGKPITKEEREAILGYGPEGV